MKVEEVTTLLSIAGTYQANLKPSNPQDSATMVKAWYMALDTRMTLNEGMVLLAALASETKRIHPGTLNESYLLSIRPAHQQGIGRPHLPFAPKAVERPIPLAIGAPEPVAPTAVPEYVAARKEQHAKHRSQNAALRAPCEYCHAESGRRCVDGNGRPLTHRWAHPSREETSRLIAV